MPTNILQQVVTYQPSELAYLQNLNCFLSTANKKFENFENLTANLGSTVNMELPYRFTTSNGLVAVDQPITQRYHPLTVDQSANTSMSVTNPEQIFNLNKDAYMNKIGKSAIRALGAQIESNIALNTTSDVPVMIPDPANPNYYIPSGAYHTESGPYRFFGDGVTALTSYQQLAQMVANWREVGSTNMGDIKIYMPNTIIPAIIGTSHGQFTPERNNETAMSWEIGRYGTPNTIYYQSNLLPIHIAGSVGNGSTTAVKQLTVVSTNDATGTNVTQITCTCDASLSGDVNAIKRGDLCQFIDVSGKPNMRTMTSTGNKVTSQPVQMRITVDAAASGTTVVINILAGSGVGLTSAPGANQNINNAIQAGMKIQVLPSHRTGLLVDGDALFVAMPRLPDQTPFPTASENDKDTGASLRLSYGALLGQNLQRLVHDCIWASTLPPEYCLRLVLPL
jgi:hypothetical protein